MSRGVLRLVVAGSRTRKTLQDVGIGQGLRQAEATAGEVVNQGVVLVPA